MERLTIRLAPRPEEALSSYLLRMANANGLAFNTLFAGVQQHFESRTLAVAVPSSMDLSPHVLNLGAVEQLTAVDVPTLRGMTLEALVDKLVGPHDLGTVHRLLHAKFEKRERRFCPRCVAEGPTYKVLWQLRDIRWCDRHDQRLRSTCAVCGTSQPYAADSLAAGHCINGCEAWLGDEATEQAPTPAERDDQRRKYAQYRLLLDPTAHLVSSDLRATHGAVRATWIMLGHMAWASDTWNRRQLVAAKVALTGSAHRQRKSSQDVDLPTVARLLAVADHNGIDLAVAHQRAVPPEFVEWMTQADNRGNKFFDPSRVCLTPWCRAQGTYRELVFRRGAQARKRHHNKLFRDHAVCHACWISYGVDPDTGRWTWISDLVPMVRQVWPLAAQGLIRRHIQLATGLAQTQVERSLGYLLGQGLLPDATRNHYGVELLSEAVLVDRFEWLTREPGGMPDRAATTWGWSNLAYFTYFYTPAVLQHLATKAPEIHSAKWRATNAGQRKGNFRTSESEDVLLTRVNKILDEYLDADRPVSMESVAAASTTTVERLVTLGLRRRIGAIQRAQEERTLRTQAEAIIASKRRRNEALVLRDLCDELGRTSLMGLRRWQPQLYHWLKQVVDADANERREDQTATLIARIDKAIARLRAQGEPATFARVMDEAGITFGWLYRHDGVAEYLREATHGVDQLIR